MKKIYAWLSDEERDALAEYCDKEGRSMYSVLKEAVGGIIQGESSNLHHPPSAPPSPITPKQDNLNEDVQRLDSDMVTLQAEIKDRGREISDLGSLCHSLRSDDQRIKGEVESIKETVRTHGERLEKSDEKIEMLYGLPPIVYDNQVKTAKLEEHTNDLDVRLDDEKRQRKESDSSLRWWLAIGGVLAFFWFLSRQRPAEMQSLPQIAPQIRQAEVAARAYVAARTFAHNNRRSRIA